jgi:hypothetical protein
VITLLIACATSPAPERAQALPVPEACQALCERQNQARAVAWEVVVADCETQCAEPAAEPAAETYTGIVIRVRREFGDELWLALPDGRQLRIAEGAEVEGVGREATLSSDQLVQELQ